ncbi:MAG: hypothetical protein COA33_000700 [Fluviicola sp.]|nr:hypothetical protein [Fluviicola sp.]
MKHPLSVEKIEFGEFTKKVLAASKPSVTSSSSALSIADTPLKHTGAEVPAITRNSINWRDITTAVVILAIIGVSIYLYRTHKKEKGESKSI